MKRPSENFLTGKSAIIRTAGKSSCSLTILTPRTRKLSAPQPPASLKLPAGTPESTRPRTTMQQPSCSHRCSMTESPGFPITQTEKPMRSLYPESPTPEVSRRRTDSIPLPDGTFPSTDSLVPPSTDRYRKQQQRKRTVSSVLTVPPWKPSNKIWLFTASTRLSKPCPTSRTRKV